MSRIVMAAALCVILSLCNIPGRTQSVITNPPGGYINPWENNNGGNPREDAARVVLSIDEPAYVDMPIWASIRFQGTVANLQQDLRYPFSANPFFMREHNFEVIRDGILLSPRKPVASAGFASYGAASAASCAPPSAPGGRLPLHLLYRFDEPGAYSVHYVLLLKSTKKNVPPTTLASNWVTLVVHPYPAEDRRDWQQEQVAHPPTDAGILVGGYLPSLLASPDDTVLPAFVAALQHPDLLVRSYALNALSYFNQQLINPHGQGVRATLSIDGPAYVDMPIWASVKFVGEPTILQKNFRYPFSANPADTWEHAFEVSRNGVRLIPRPAPPGAAPGALVHYAGAYAPPTAPSGRLPLHLCYQFDKPGTYCVRYILRGEAGHAGVKAPAKAPVQLSSNVVTLVVKACSAEQRRQWQQAQMVHPPTDAGLLVGKYLPALLASPDTTVLPAFVAALRIQDAQVTDYTLHALAYFDDAVWKHAIATELQQHGPTDSLTELLFAWQCRMSQSEVLALVDHITPFLAGNNPQQAVGALQSLSCLRVQTERKALPEATRRIDAAVMAAMPHLLALDNATLHALTVYLGATRSDSVHELLWQLTAENGTRDHAFLCLCTLADQRDLRRLGDAMLKSDDASLPATLHKAYREAAIPYLQSGHQFAANADVRNACEREFE